MRKLALAAVLLAGTAFASMPAQADIIIDTTGQGGTGNNVIFSSIFSPDLILGKLNGQNDEVVRFSDRTVNPDPLFPFSGSANGNDIKIVNSLDLDITVFNSTNLTQLGVVRDVFSLVGEGTVFFKVTALEADNTFKNFLFGGYDLKNGQNGFDFKAINGEAIWDLDLYVSPGGRITDFEHFRIDVAAAVPGPLAGAGIPGLIAACGALWGLGWRRRRNTVA